MIAARLGRVPSFFSIIPVGSDRTGQFELRSGHWRQAAREYAGLPMMPHLSPSVPRALSGSALSGGAQGLVVGEMPRASSHASCCVKGEFKLRRHNDVAGILCGVLRWVFAFAFVDFLWGFACDFLCSFNNLAWSLTRPPANNSLPRVFASIYFFIRRRHAGA